MIDQDRLARWTSTGLNLAEITDFFRLPGELVLRLLRDTARSPVVFIDFPPNRVSRPLREPLGLRRVDGTPALFVLVDATAFCASVVAAAGLPPETEPTLEAVQAACWAEWSSAALSRG